jgi:hypothetical protein
LEGPRSPKDCRHYRFDFVIPEKGGTERGIEFPRGKELPKGCGAFALGSTRRRTKEEYLVTNFYRPRAKDVVFMICGARR